jgi:N-methylhydantoinase B/oxoprolinase/acetone carboxylase alpha subunit
MLTEVALFWREYEKNKEEVVKILEEQNIAVVNAPVADWCLIQDVINFMPSFKRNSVLRPAFIIG